MPSRLGEPAHDGRPCSHPVDRHGSRPPLVRTPWWQDTAPGPVLPTDEIDARRITRTSDAGHHADLPERTRRCRALGSAAFLCAWRQSKHAGRQSGVAVRQLPPSGRPEDTGGGRCHTTSAENQQSVEQHQFGWRTGGATRFARPDHVAELETVAAERLGEVSARGQARPRTSGT